jgi:hypothetical protein
MIIKVKLVKQFLKIEIRNVYKILSILNVNKLIFMIIHFLFYIIHKTDFLLFLLLNIQLL